MIIENNFLSYIKGVKSSLSKNNPVTFVLGNEAADLDSITSAVLYAYYLNLKGLTANPIPLINIPREDFKLRTEAVFLFNHSRVDVDNLIFIDDIDLIKLKENNYLKLILVDHNKLSSAHSEFQSCISAILDHHEDENDYPEGIFVDIRPVGSTATIVGECFLKDQPDDIEKSMGTLLLGTILLDTINLDPAAGRVSDDDRKIAQKLIELTKLDKDVLFKKIQFEKFNVSSLGSYDLLRKDYKEWQMGSVKCGIGSVLLSVGTWIDNDPHIVSAYDIYLKERNLNVLITMNAFTHSGFTRQIVVYIPEKKLRTDTLVFLESSELDLEKIKTPVLTGAGKCLFYNQANLVISRKKLQPILKDFFENHIK
jgi:exopolyphosphatase